jgi:membrane protease YdiL (CAAX protease family)
MTSNVSTVATRTVLTRIPDSLAWMGPDLLRRLAPFALAVAVVEIGWRPSWLGLTPGRLGAQLIFAAVAAPVLFVAATYVQLRLAQRRGALSVPAGAGDAWFQAGFYALNGPIEEGLFRGLIQGGISVAFGAPAGFIAGTATYVLYHRLGWPWAETLATALLGIPVGLAFWLLPGPPSLLGVSIAHIAATCGFLGPGPYLLKKLGLV